MVDEEIKFLKGAIIGANVGKYSTVGKILAPSERGRASDHSQVSVDRKQGFSTRADIAFPPDD